MTEFTIPNLRPGGDRKGDHKITKLLPGFKNTNRWRQSSIDFFEINLGIMAEIYKDTVRFLAQTIVSDRRPIKKQSAQIPDGFQALPPIH